MHFNLSIIHLMERVFEFEGVSMMSVIYAKSVLFDSQNVLIGSLKVYRLNKI